MEIIKCFGNTEQDMKKKEYTLLIDILYEYEDKQYKLEKKIEALKSNSSYRSLFKKDYLERTEKEKKGIDIIIKALNHLIWITHKTLA